MSVVEKFPSVHRAGLEPAPSAGEAGERPLGRKGRPRRDALLGVLVWTFSGCAGRTVDTGDAGDESSSASSETSSTGESSATSATASSSSDDGSETSGDEAGTCSLPPLDSDVLDGLTLGLFAPVVELQPGDLFDFDLLFVECCYTTEEVEACVEWSVDVEHASIDSNGELRVHDDAPPGTRFSVYADIEAGRRVLEREIFVYTPESAPLKGSWTEVAQLDCNDGSELSPEQPIAEFVVWAEGSFFVTWTPFELYVDYGGTYVYLPPSTDFEAMTDGGNYLPVDFEGSGSAEIDGQGRLVLRDLWLGSPQGASNPPRCGHVFE